MTNDIKDLVFVGANSQLVTTSRKVAEVFGKQHKVVLHAIETLLSSSAQNCADSEVRKMFEKSTYLDSKNREQAMYIMNRDGFSLLAMGFTGDKAMSFKLRFIGAFNKMEAHIKEENNKPVITNEAIMLMLQQNQAMLQKLYEHDVQVSDVNLRTSKLESVREDNIAELNSLPEIIAEPVTEAERKDLLRRKVVVYAEAKGLSICEVWQKIYQDLYDIYHKNPGACKKIKPNESKLDICIRKGYFNLVESIVKNLTEK